ncbi:hypothetical protein [Maridesulfovibrio salexigens]|uniref:Uncharacterized protein n=1 Tax=Maridesulfovibrio salexigens (strain ATCC 14822 / DSM 2638 / NCIMB 8403 / VKM B-1763) TaxID=526222 RepID=C6BW07_MARSD|nr:hypothetical protein [Maridesulfovibrio salexigens]ACS80210.1 hypothetical protein Desal_2152 [Maridesulfovibrio salexigens DSM 2638]
MNATAPLFSIIINADGVTFLTAVAALITSIVTFFSVLEMKRQRIVTQKPILKFTNIFFKSPLEDSAGKESISIPIYNFGTGTAIDIEVKWVVDRSLIVKKINEVAKQNIATIEKNFGELTIIKVGKTTYGFSDREEKLLAITPYRKNDLQQRIQLPSFFIDGHAEFVKNNNGKSLATNDFPTARLKIKYKDINDERYCEHFKVHISPQVISYGDRSITECSNILKIEKCIDS